MPKEENFTYLSSLSKLVPTQTNPSQPSGCTKSTSNIIYSLIYILDFLQILQKFRQHLPLKMTIPGVQIWHQTINNNNNNIGSQ